MNLLYISSLSNNVDAGLNWSVPASVKAQGQLDNVLWINLTDAYQEHWSNVDGYHNIQNFGETIRLNILPEPFNNPDCVIFEGFYYYEHVLFAKKLRRKNIPYIIVPRSAFTNAAFRNGGLLKRIKKSIAHKLLFDPFIKKATAIQFLTEEEKKESEVRYRLPSFIVPNGIPMPETSKAFSSDQIKGVFIGRQDIYQKGFDLLLEAISEMRSDLKSAGFHLDIYGPPRYDYMQISKMIDKMSLSDLVTNHERGTRGKEKEYIILGSDVFFLTSRFEGHPMGLIEALSYGLPAFITRGSNMYDEILKSEAGWVCETSKEAIVASLKQMINDRQKLNTFSKNAVELAKKYNWDTLAVDFHDSLSKFLD